MQLRPFVAMFAIVAALLMLAGTFADARPGGGGSRGMRTFSAPPTTNTAPRQAAPLERSMTQPGAATAAARPGAAAAAGGDFFNRPGLLGGLAAGFLGAGLFGMLFGQGMFGNMGGFASVLGLLLQVGLVVIVARLAWAWWQRRNGMAFAGPMQGHTANNFDSATGAAQANGSGLGGGSMNAGSNDVELGKDDYDAFENLLGDIQTAYGREDLSALRAHVTPEMMSYFSDDLSANASRGVRNDISDVKLLQGDLSEAWSEGSVQYATLAMRFSLVDRMIERDSGRVVEGGETEATELWTFMRSHGGKWLLSAIQQA